MFIQRIHKKTKNKTYTSVVLMENYREQGKVKHRIISNISKWPEDIIVKFENLLKGNSLVDISDLDFTSGKSFGGIYVINEIMKRSGISKALGNSMESKLAMFQIAGRILSQGSSRLRLASEWKNNQAIQEVFKLGDFTEDSLYRNLDWLSENQDSIERKLFSERHLSHQVKEIYMYDVTSSYLEGDQNELACYGYNRDQKKGKKQIVIGLLCDKEGYPISIEVFDGNTNDTKTVLNQLKKLKENFGIEKVVFVGDKGMIKKQQIETLLSQEFEWNYITSITKNQINSLINKGVVQLSLFDTELAEVEDNGVRYVLRRNPVREEEIAGNRAQKIEKVKQEVKNKNIYLQEHGKAKEQVAIRKTQNLISRLKLTKVISCKIENRIISLDIDDEAAKQAFKLDGCYVIKTDLTKQEISKQEIHDRYKDLALVEFAFRTIKTTIEEIRPIYVRKEKRTRGHVLVCMLAYIIVKHITDKTKKLGYTRKHIFESLDKITYTAYEFKKEKIKILPKKLLEHQDKILEKLEIKLPKYA